MIYGADSRFNVDLKEALLGVGQPFSHDVNEPQKGILLFDLGWRGRLQTTSGRMVIKGWGTIFLNQKSSSKKYNKTAL